VSRAGGLPRKPGDRVLVKPNIVYGTRKTDLPKWGVITTSRVVEDVVRLLRDCGAGEIIIAEGSVVANPRDTATQEHAFDTLGYRVLERRYGARCVNVLNRPFTRADFGDGMRLSFSRDAMESDLIVSLPVLKTHAQTVVSLGIKNLKGLISIPSRKRCHNPDTSRDLNQWVSRLADPLPPVFTLIDGIYSNERGPAFDGRIRRSDLLVASGDVFAADKVGASILGHDPADVPHLRHYGERRGRPLDLSDLEIRGERLDGVRAFHAHDFPYTPDGSLPLPLAQKGISGVAYYKYDLTMCTYCSGLTGAVLTAIAAAWRGEPWPDVEVLTGKRMAPRPGMKKTILLGKCISALHKNNPDIADPIPVDGCPPDPAEIVKALPRAGIQVDPGMIENHDLLPGFLMDRYRRRPEFAEGFFRIT